MNESYFKNIKYILSFKLLLLLIIYTYEGYVDFPKNLNKNMMSVYMCMCSMVSPNTLRSFNHHSNVLVHNSTFHG